MTAKTLKPLCRCCGKRPVAGWVPSHRVTLERHCLKCWKTWPEEPHTGPDWMTMKRSGK